MSAARDRTGVPTLRVDRLVDGVEYPTSCASGARYGVFRAVKSAQLLRECVDLLDGGGVAALVPDSATSEYVDRVVTQVATFATQRSVSDDGILVLATSGSTGLPKLVAIPAAGVGRFLGWGAGYFGLDASTVSLSISPWNFDVALLDTWAVLAAGGSVIAADARRLHDVRHVARLLTAHRPTFVQVVPATLDPLVLAARAGDGTTVRDIVLTGGVAAQPSRRAAAEAFPAARFHNVYGSTEVNDCLIHTMSAADFGELESLPLGVPLDGCTVALAGADAVLPVGDVNTERTGEVLVRTPWMALGYVAEAAVQPLPGREVDGLGRLYPMNDRVACVDGRLTYLGRQDRLVKLRGQRVDLAEVEHVAHDTGLISLAHAWITGTDSAQQLHLAYTAAEGASASSALELRVRMSHHLPPHAMPGLLHRFGSTFPLNGNGKPDLPTIESHWQGRET